MGIHPLPGVLDPLCGRPGPGVLRTAGAPGFSSLWTPPTHPQHSQVMPTELRWSLTHSRPSLQWLWAVCACPQGEWSRPWGAHAGRQIWISEGRLRRPQADSLPAPQQAPPGAGVLGARGSQEAWALRAACLISADGEFNECFQRGQTAWDEWLTPKIDSAATRGWRGPEQK